MSSFSRLLQNAPYYSPAAFTPGGRKRRAGPASEPERARRARPLVDPYATLTAPEFDNFVDNVSSRIVNALTCEPNRDRRIRRGYADDEEYWMEMGGKPGEFVGNEMETETLEGEKVDVQEPEVEAQVEADADGSIDEVMDVMETGEAQDASALEADIDGEDQEEDQVVPIDEITTVDQFAIPPNNLFNSGTAASGTQQLYPDLKTLDDFNTIAEPVPPQYATDIEIPSNSLYPSLADLQQDTAPPVTVNEEYQFDLLRQFTHESYGGYEASSQELDTSNMQSIDDLLSMAEKDAEEANEAIRHIQEEDEIEQELDEALLEEIEHVVDEPIMQVDADEEDIAIASEDDEEEEMLSDAELTPEAPAVRQTSASKEVSDVISIGSTSDEEEEEDEEDDADNEAIDLEEEEDQEEEEELEEDTNLEATPPPAISLTGPSEHSRQLFGQLDAPISSQARFMSQKIKKRMDEDDLRTSGFDEEDGPTASGSSEASDEYSREWRQFRRKAGKGQRAQDEQDAADRYFDDEQEDDDERHSRVSDEQEEEESEEEESEEESSAARPYSRINQKAAEGEFEDELDDDAIADEEREAIRSNAALDDRVPIPAFFKRDKQTGEYELRLGSSDDEEEEDEGEETEDEVLEEAHIEEDLRIEVLDDEGVAIQVEENVNVDVQSEDILDPALSSALMEDTEDVEIVDEHINLAVSEKSVPPEDAFTASAGPGLTINELIESSMSEDSPALADFTSLPPLPQSLMDIANQLIEDTTEEATADLANTLEEAIQDAFTSTTSEANVAPVREASSSPRQRAQRSPRRKSREPSLPASIRTPRKSAEPALLTSMGVSPEQFSLPRRSVTPSANISTSVSAQDPDVSASQSARALLSNLQSISAQGETEDSLETTPAAASADPSQASSRDMSLTQETSAFTEDHHHEPPPPELQEEEHFSPSTKSHRDDDMMVGVDLTTDEMESHSADEEEEAERPSETHFTEDHHHEPPPPELQDEEHFAPSATRKRDEDIMVGVDITTDEMEAHSADEVEEGERSTEAPFTEDHHFEPPPLELQEGSEVLVGEEVLPESGPLGSVDMTTDEMEQHSGDEVEAGPVHEIGYKGSHLFEPPLLPSQHGDDHVEDAEATTAEQGPSIPQPEESAKDVSEAAPVDTPQVEQAVAPVSAPTVATPTRAFNVIQPGLWDPSTPIRFGGKSLEAAVREAYYDPDRSAHLRKSLGTEEAEAADLPQEDQIVPEQPSSSNKRHAKFSDDVGDDSSFVPVNNVDKDSDEDEDITTALISSPGVRQADGSLTQAVQEGDFIGDTVTDVLAEDSELPPLEPEVLETIEVSDGIEQSASPASALQSSSASIEEDIEEEARVPVSPSASQTPQQELLSSSDESDEDAHHIAASLLRARSTANKDPAKTRRGRSRTRRTPESSRKGKQRAQSQSESGVEVTSEDTGYLSSSSSEGENLIRVNSKRQRSPSAPSEGEETETTSRERAVTPTKDSHGRNIVTTVIVPGSPIDPTTPMEEMEVSAMLAPQTSRPRLHKHGASKNSSQRLSPPSSRRRRGSISSRSSASRTSAEPVSGSSAAPVHPDPEHQRHGHASVGGNGGSPIQTRSQCTYRKLMIPNPYLGSINTPGRRISTRLARVAGEAANEPSQQDFPASFVFLVPGCVTADRKEQMQEGGIVDLGVASVEEEGSAMALQTNEENETGLHVEGLPDSIVQSLVRVVGLEMFREGDCEILSPLIPGSPARSGSGNGTERKRRRESDMMSPPGAAKRLR